MSSTISLLQKVRAEAFKEHNHDPLTTRQATIAIALTVIIVVFDIVIHNLSQAQAPLAELVHDLGDGYILVAGVYLNFTSGNTHRKEVRFTLESCWTQFIMIALVVLFVLVPQILDPQPVGNLALVVIGGIVTSLLNVCCAIFVKGETLKCLHRCLLIDAGAGLISAITGVLIIVTGKSGWNALGAITILLMTVWVIWPLYKDAKDVLDTAPQSKPDTQAILGEVLLDVMKSHEQISFASFAGLPDSTGILPCVIYTKTSERKQHADIREAVQLRLEERYGFSPWIIIEQTPNDTALINAIPLHIPKGVTNIRDYLKTQANGHIAVS